MGVAGISVSLRERKVIDLPQISLTQEQFEKVKSAILDYTFLGHKFDRDWTKENEVDLRNSILKKFGLTGDDSTWCSWHSEGCRCHGCSNIRKGRKRIDQMRKLIGGGD